MKYTKMIISLLAVLAVVCVLGCKKTTDPAFTMNDEQKAAYETLIGAFLSGSIDGITVKNEISEDEVQGVLKAHNEYDCIPKGFKVVDTKAGTSIAAGTTKDDLKKRFIPQAK